MFEPQPDFDPVHLCLDLERGPLWDQRWLGPVRAGNTGRKRTFPATLSLDFCNHCWGWALQDALGGNRGGENQKVAKERGTEVISTKKKILFVPLGEFSGKQGTNSGACKRKFLKVDVIKS